MKKFQASLNAYRTGSPQKRNGMRAMWLNQVLIGQDRQAQALLFAIFGILVLRR